MRRNRLEKNKAALIQMGKDFTIYHSGPYAELNYDDKTVKFIPSRFAGISGAHLSLMVRRDIDINLPQPVKHTHPELTISEFITDPPHVYINANSIDEAKGQICYQVDIDDCYWRTLFLKGLITERTYLKGLEKKEWKIGRNAAIGALDKKNTRLEIYKKGILTHKERIHMPANYRYARFMVIHHVNHIAQKIIRELQSSFIMFMTDCFIVTPGNIKVVADMLKIEGYSCKTDTVEMIDHNPERKFVSWRVIKHRKITDDAGGRFAVTTDKKSMNYSRNAILYI